MAPRATPRAAALPATFPRYAVVQTTPLERNVAVVGFLGDDPPPGAIAWCHAGDPRWTPCAVPFADKAAAAAARAARKAEAPLFDPWTGPARSSDPEPSP